jgi:GNAT superfamily N-acetyltransferase
VLSRRDRLEFVRFPWRIYANDSQWVPPLEMERLQFIDRASHPFYKHGDAAMFLARRGGAVVGRILASDDPRYNAEHGTNAGAFGMFETIDDQGVASSLLNAASQWMAARGRTAMLGPIDYSTNYACGLLVDGFNTPPRVMMNHNPRYYAGLLEAYGLAKAKDLYSWWFDDELDMIQKWRRRADFLAARGVVIRTFRRSEIKSEVMRCKNIYNEAWERHWGFVKMTDAEFRAYGKFLAELAIPELLLLAEVDGQPVGFSLTLPDFNEALVDLNGRLTRWGLPTGYFKFRRNLRQIRTARLVTFGILDQYRRRGIAELLILRTLDYGKNVLGYSGAELGWTLEDNDSINRPIATVGGQKYKTYRIYEKALG